MEFKEKKELSSGLSSTAYVLDNKYIQLEGKSKESFKTYEEMKSNSDLLEGKLSSVSFPHNMTLIEPCNKYPLGSLIYPMIQGSNLNPKTLTKEQKENIAKKIIAFNNELHSLNIHWDRESSIKHEISKINRNIEILKTYIDKDKIKILKKYSILFKRYLESKKQFCITHGDLYADNLIVDGDNNLTGIIDFGNMAYFLPEVDYASMWNMTDNFIDLLLKYTKEDVTKESINLFIVHRELCSFEYILDVEPEDIPCQLEKLKQAINLIEPQLIAYQKSL